MKRILYAATLLAALLLLASGCVSVVKTGDIISVKERLFGLSIHTSDIGANGAPSVDLGFISSVVQFIPTSTNGPVHAPDYADSFDLGQGIAPFSTRISEDTATGRGVPTTNPGEPLQLLRPRPKAALPLLNRPSPLPTNPPPTAPPRPPPPLPDHPPILLPPGLLPTNPPVALPTNPPPSRLTPTNPSRGISHDMEIGRWSIRRQLPGVGNLI